MITKITDAFRDNYQALFANATNALKTMYPNKKPYNEDSFSINTLEGYFTHLSQLIASKGGVSADGDRYYSGISYTILPLEEPVFNIDANSRIIHVPNEMKNVGVAGDTGAEILYFSIDRYFDNMDLAANGMKTVIEWKNSNAKNKKEGIDEAYVTLIDIPSYLDDPEGNNLKGQKILIGWALGGDVMSGAGTIEFTIRFFQSTGDLQNPDEQTILYSFSTQPAKVTVSKTLQYDIAKDKADAQINNMIATRISRMVSSGISGILNAPIFKINLDRAYPNLIDTEHDVTEFKVKDYNDVETQLYYMDLPNGVSEYRIYALAESNEGYECTYTWYYKSLTGAEYHIYEDDDKHGIEFIKITSESDKEGITLYEYTGNGYQRTTETSGEDLYCRVSYCTVTKPGYYHVQARITSAVSSAVTQSYSIKVPGPVTPIIQSSEPVNEEGYISVILNPVDETALLVTVDKEAVKNQNNILEYDESNITKYMWQQASLNNREVYETLEGNTTNECKIASDAEGWYRVTAKNTRNNMVDTLTSNVINYRVTKAPLNAIITAKLQELVLTSLGKQGLHFKIDSTIPSDKITVAWSIDNNHIYDQVMTYQYLQEHCLVEDTNEYLIIYNGPVLPQQGNTVSATVLNHYNNSPASEAVDAGKSIMVTA